MVCLCQHQFSIGGLLPRFAKERHAGCVGGWCNTSKQHAMLGSVKIIHVNCKEAAMLIEIDTYDGRLDFDLFEISENTTLSVGDQKALPGGFTMTSEGLIIRKAFGFPET